MIRNSPKRSAKWCASSASAGSLGANAARSCSRRARCAAWRSSASIAPDSTLIAIAHSRYTNGSGVTIEIANSAADVRHARVIRARSRSVSPPPAPACAAARMTRTTARLAANTVLSPTAAGSIATAATPTGTLPARNSTRSAI